MYYANVNILHRYQADHSVRHGTPKCTCQEGFTGETCSVTCPNGQDNNGTTEVCGGHGECFAEHGKAECICSPAYLQISSQYNLGNYYREGSHGLTQSSKRAIEFYTLASNQGHAKAQYNLGAYYCNGTGVEQSYTKAEDDEEVDVARGQSFIQIQCLSSLQLPVYFLNQYIPRFVPLVT